MPIEGFNPEEFSKNLTSQVVGVIPQDLSEEDKKFVVNIVYKFLIMAAGALNKDDNSPLNAQQASTITQFIGEWAFHKSVDLSRAKIPQPLREPVLQAVAFSVFDEAKKVIINNVDRDEAITRIEERVKAAYQSSLQGLAKENKIDKDSLQRALSESNIDRMAEEAKQHNSEENQKPVEMPDQLLKLAAISLVLKKMPPKQVEVILSKIDPRDATAINSYMKLDGLETKLDMQKAQKFINEFMHKMPKEPQKINEDVTISKINKLKTSLPQGTLENILKNERENIKKILEDEETLKDLSPKIMNILYNYLEEKAYSTIHLKKKSLQKNNPLKKLFKNKLRKKTCSNQAYSLMKNFLTPFSRGRKEDAATDAEATEEQTIEISYQEPKTKPKILNNRQSKTALQKGSIWQKQT